MDTKQPTLTWDEQQIIDRVLFTAKLRETAAENRLMSLAAIRHAACDVKSLPLVQDVIEFLCNRSEGSVRTPLGQERRDIREYVEAFRKGSDHDTSIIAIADVVYRYIRPLSVAK